MEWVKRKGKTGKVESSGKFLFLVKIFPLDLFLKSFMK